MREGLHLLTIYTSNARHSSRKHTTNTNKSAQDTQQFSSFAHIYRTMPRGACFCDTLRLASDDAKFKQLPLRSTVLPSRSTVSTKNDIVLEQQRNTLLLLYYLVNT